MPHAAADDDDAPTADARALDGDDDRDDAARARDADADADADTTRDAKRAKVELAAGGGARESVGAAPAPVAAVANALAGASGGTVVVHGVPQSWSEREFGAFLESLGATRASYRKKARWPYGFVTFGALADRIAGEALLRGASVQGRELKVSEAKPRGGGKTGADGVDVSGMSAAEAVVAKANANALRDIRDVICPLWNVKYGEQLARKKEIVAENLRAITRAVRNASQKARKQGRRFDVEWLRSALDNDKLACPLEGIVRSPILDGYRNKSEFTIGPSAANEPTVGFNVGLFREGVTAVAAPVGCRNISSTAKFLAAAAETHLRALAAQGHGLPVYDKRDATGFWRLFIVREGGMAPESEHGWKHWLRPGVGPPKPEAGNDGKPIEANDKDVTPFEYPDEEASLPAPTTKDAHSEVMVMLQVRKEGYDDETIRGACRGMLDALEAAAATASPPINLKVCVVQFYDGLSNAAPDDAEIRNLKTDAPSEKTMDVIHESMCGLRFSLSATAFFQVNTVAAEALYRLAGEWASPNGKSLLLDVCCGTGTIGLTLAKDVAKVVGVDIVEESIKDAFVNATLNGVSNSDWVAGKAEVAIPRILNEYKSLIKPEDGARRGMPSVAALDDPDMSADEDTEAALQHQRTVLNQTSVEYLYDDVVAIVDPPRAGLHRQVLVALRRENRLKRLVYVSCNAKTMADNVIELCLPQGQDGNGGGVPFKPIKALALDLFPHTEHVEAIMLLER